MILPDVNILIHAFDPADPKCARSRTVLFEPSDEGALGLTSTVVSAFIRICGNPRIFKQPAPREVLLTYADALIAVPFARRVEPGPMHWPVFRRLLAAGWASPDLVTDAWLAALAIEKDALLVSFDRDFEAFQGLRRKILS